MLERTERGLEIVRLHDAERLSYRAIGERLGISKGRASQIYHDVLRQQREVRRSEFYKTENTKMISFPLTLGEAVVLQRILHNYTLSESMKLRNNIGNPDLEALETECIDYISAGKLLSRLRDTEKENRVPLNDSEKSVNDGVCEKEPYHE